MTPAILMGIVAVACFITFMLFSVDFIDTARGDVLRYVDAAIATTSFAAFAVLVVMTIVIPAGPSPLTLLPTLT